MPPRSLSKMLTNHIVTVLNIGIVVLSFFESYMFPLAIMKWMIVITKYSGVPLFLEKTDNHEKSIKTRYQYSLQLITCCGKGKSKVRDGVMQKRVSNVSVFVEDDSTLEDHKWMQVRTYACQSRVAVRT